MKKKEEVKPAKRRKNREVYLFGGLFTALFAVLFVYLSVYVASNHEELFNNSYNSRQRVLAAQNRRGSIYSADGETLACTVSEDGTEGRQYPFGSVCAHVVGYTAQGKSGLEELENYALSNSDIPQKERFENEQNGRKNPGNDVYSTLDTGVQQAAYDALGAYRGAIVATEVETGRIVAMVSKPDFDPNQISADWEKISQDTENAVLLNRVTQGLYPPGSTFKIVTALAYLRQFPDTWQDYSYQCTGVFQSGENRITCFHGSVHGQVDLQTSFAKSCNCSFANLGLMLPREEFGDTIDNLLFHEKLPIELPYRQSGADIGADSPDADVIQTAIGQGKTQMTPMHLNLITMAIANEGVLMKPYLVDRVENAYGEAMDTNSPQEYGQLLSREEAAVLTSLMESVVTEGTGRQLQGRSYTAAGKTGSAEFSDDTDESHAWFTGFAPAQDPKIAVTVVVESIGSGGDYAVPLARRVFDAYFEEN